VYGARPLKRAIQQMIEIPREADTRGHFGPKDTVRVQVKKREFVFDKIIEAIPV